MLRDCYALMDRQALQSVVSLMRVIVTGGAGFIGSAVVRRLISENAQVLNIDKLTYAATLWNVADVERSPNYQFLSADITDASAIASAFSAFRPTAVIHLAAESHVDRSIDGPAAFLKTNITGTFVMLQSALEYVSSRRADEPEFRFVLISTDEVYGSLGASGRFSEESAYAPNSPYSASKAAADHLARAWFHTYGLPVLITNCSNNYGPYQHAEKLIPTVIRAALAGDAIPVYGAGANVRDWLHVDDHVEGILAALQRGRPGEKYNFGGDAEVSNLDLVKLICEFLDRRVGRPDGMSYAGQIAFVADRPGHDFRYAIDSSKAASELSWRRKQTLASGLPLTIDWYLERKDWLLAAPNSGRLGLKPSLRKLRTME
jgi:dTDP-glucose 4,6-dehydratase